MSNFMCTVRAHENLLNSPVYIVVKKKKFAKIIHNYVVKFIFNNFYILYKNSIIQKLDIDTLYDLQSYLKIGLNSPCLKFRPLTMRGKVAKIKRGEYFRVYIALNIII